MSQLSEFLTRIGVPRELLNYGQKLINDWKGEAAKLLPTPQALVDSIQAQPDFKRIYRALSDEAKAGVDQALLTICTCALVKMRKALGL